MGYLYNRDHSSLVYLIFASRWPFPGYHDYPDGHWLALPIDFVRRSFWCVFLAGDTVCSRYKVDTLQQVIHVTNRLIACKPRRHSSVRAQGPSMLQLQGPVSTYGMYHRIRDERYCALGAASVAFWVQSTTEGTLIRGQIMHPWFPFYVPWEWMSTQRSLAQ